MLGLKVQDNAEFGAEIIRKVREREGLSRVELARELGVAASTIGRHVDALVSGQYFSETVEPTREAGRPPTRLRPNPRRGCFIGIDFHSKGLFATAVDFAQQTITQKSYPLTGSAGVEVVLEEIGNALVDMRQAAELPVLAAGIATPGRVDAARGIGTYYVHIPGFVNVPMSEKLSAVVGAPVHIENNIRLMALAERWFGAGKGCQEMLCLGVRIGVAAGVIRGGQLATGHRALGGEIRGWNCPTYDAVKNRWDWSPGVNLESRASLPVALARYKDLSGNTVEQAGFIEAVQNGDSAALTALKELAAIHGWVISQMAQLTDPEVVVIAGPLTHLGSLYQEMVTEKAREFASDFYPAVPIKLSELGDYAGAVGAAALALARWRPEDMG